VSALQRVTKPYACTDSSSRPVFLKSSAMLCSVVAAAA
jgi:hypothetical protein